MAVSPRVVHFSTQHPVRVLVAVGKAPGPALPSWLKIYCPKNETGTRRAKYDAAGKLLIPAATIYKCHLKLSLSYLTKGVIPCETPILVTVYITAYFDLNGTPVFDVYWSGPVVGTGRNVWRGVSRFANGFKHILENFIPVG